MSFGKLGAMGRGFGRLGAPGKPAPPSGGTPTGTGTMDFSVVTGDNTALLALLEDI